MFARRVGPLALLPVVVFAACKGTEPFVPRATTVLLSPSSVSFTALGATQSVSAAVLDQRGDTMAGASVTWSSNNTGVATASPTPLSSAVVSAVGNGSTEIVATSGGASAQVTVTVAQVAGQILKVSGDGQTDTVGQQLPNPLAAQVNDAQGNPMPNIIVNFQVTQGGGSLSAPSDTTGANGQVQVSWTIGTTAGGAQAVLATATTGSAPPATFSAAARAGAPTTLTREAGDSQRAAVSTPVPIAPAVRLRDAYDNPVPSVVVTFEVIAGGGSVMKPSDTTDANGIASVGWTLGSSPGQNELTAAMSGGGSLTFTFIATAAVPGPPATVVVSAGDNQTGLAGYALNVDPAVLVRDSSDLPVANAQVDFGPSAGGSVTGSPAFTDANGVATVGSWSVAAGANMLSATVAGSSISPATFNATGATQQYAVEVRYLTTATPAQQAAFDSAKARWQRLIFGDEPNVFVNFPANTCGDGTPLVSETVDDVIIWVRLDSIDGPGKVLGRAGPCIVRSPGLLPLVGVMQFDTADVGNLISAGQFDDVILHEMAHVLGLGTIWSSLGLIVGRVSQGGTDPHFVGGGAMAAFDRNGGLSYSAGAKVPVEDCVGFPPGVCGATTYDSHWRESVFDTELMTGFIESNKANLLSVITTASMGDLGHTVNYAASDAYTVVNAVALRTLEQAPPIELEDDILRLPIIVVDPVGRVMRVIQPR